MKALKRYLPILNWAREYNRQVFISDLLAALIVTVILIPQSFAYALLAGLPPEMGLYASMLPLVAYALFGTSRTLSVGPVAVVSLMTAAAIGRIAEPGSAGHIEAAILLALLSGLFLLVMGILRLGFLANFLSHPVIAGFITASGIIIIFSQIKYLFGVQAGGENLFQLIGALSAQLDAINPSTVIISLPTLVFLLWVRNSLKSMLVRLSLSKSTAGILSKTGPVFGIIATSAIAYGLDLGAYGVTLVGEVPTGLPELTLPQIAYPGWKALLPSAIFISIIGFVESMSVGHTLAAKHHQKIIPNQELLGLGAANIAASLSGGYPVAGGVSRSVVNFDAGAITPAAGIFTAAGTAVVAALFTPYLAYLPKATLAAIIIVAVLPLVDLSILKRAWQYAMSDFVAVVTTLAVTLGIGVETGVACGVLASLALYLYKTSRPHMAVVGEVPGTEHFRNVERHEVITHSEILSVRIDESLYFANAGYIEDRLYALLASRPKTKHVILQCTAVNEIDLSALEALESVNQRLQESGIQLHLSEVKGPVMDLLRKTRFLDQLSGRVFLSHHQAVNSVLDSGRKDPRAEN